METDSRQSGVSHQRIVTLLVVVALALVPLSGVGAAQQAGAAGNQSTYVAVQGDQCVPVNSFTGNESALEFYDYQIPSQYSDNPYANATGSAYGSEGTRDLQRPDTSIAFLYTDTTENSTYLVLVHGNEGNASSSGGAATFNITGLPADGEWVVRDDDYNDTSSVDNWNVNGSQSTVDWAWSDAATDGGVYSEIDNTTNVTIEPAFNEDAALFGQESNGTVEQWQVLSNDSDNVTRTNADLNESVQIGAGSCTDGGVDAGDNGTQTNATNATATVNFTDQESDGTSVTVDNLTVPRGGYVTIHNDSLLDGDAVGSVVGVSGYRSAGQYSNVTVDLYDVPGTEFNETELAGNQTLIAMPHEETTGNQTYDFVSSNGTDDPPYTDGGAAVTDDAVVTVVNATNATTGNGTATPSDNSTSTDSGNDSSGGPLVPGIA